MKYFWDIIAGLFAAYVIIVELRWLNEDLYPNWWNVFDWRKK